VQKVSVERGFLFVEVAFGFQVSPFAEDLLSLVLLLATQPCGVRLFGKATWQE
jgi:hypothetical protein